MPSGDGGGAAAGAVPDSSEITQLAARDARKICSMQVFPTVASVVKELLENALDAGATAVDVTLTGGGLDTIVVRDNGVGIPPSSAGLLGKPGATSKIKEYDDIHSVRTFGFRGEALNALCDIADAVEIATRTASCETGTRYLLTRAGDAEKRGVMAQQIGTCVTVTRPFGRVAVRRKIFAKDKRAHVAAIKELVVTYCCARPDVRFSLRAKDPSEHLVKSPNLDLRATVRSVFGPRGVAEALEWADESSGSGVRVSGLFPKSDKAMVTKPNRYYICVNGRPVTLKPVRARARELICSALKRPAATGHPWLFLHVDVGDGQYDVNTDKAKAELMLSRNAEDAVVACLGRIVARMFPDEEKEAVDEGSAAAGGRAASGQAGVGDAAGVSEGIAAATADGGAEDGVSAGVATGAPIAASGGGAGAASALATAPPSTSAAVPATEQARPAAPNTAETLFTAVGAGLCASAAAESQSCATAGESSGSSAALAAGGRDVRRASVAGAALGSGYESEAAGAPDGAAADDTATASSATAARLNDGGGAEGAFAQKRRAELASLSPTAAQKWGQAAQAKGWRSEGRKKRRLARNRNDDDDDDDNNNNDDDGMVDDSDVVVGSEGKSSAAGLPRHGKLPRVTAAPTTAARAAGALSGAASASTAPAGIDLFAWSRGSALGAAAGGARVFTPPQKPSRRNPRATDDSGIEVMSDDGNNASPSPMAPRSPLRGSMPPSPYALDYRSAAMSCGRGGSGVFGPRSEPCRLVGRCALSAGGSDAGAGGAWVVRDGRGIALLGVFRLAERVMFESLLRTFAVPKERLAAERPAGVADELVRRVASTLELGPRIGRRAAVADRSVTANGFDVAVLFGDGDGAGAGAGVEIVVSAAPLAGAVVGLSEHDLAQLLAGACAHRDAVGRGGGEADAAPHRPEAVKCHLEAEAVRMARAFAAADDADRVVAMLRKLPHESVAGDRSDAAHDGDAGDKCVHGRPILHRLGPLPALPAGDELGEMVV